MTTIIAILVSFASLNAPYVDRVETDDRTYTAVVCMGADGACYDVPTTRNGLQEGDGVACETHRRLDGTGAVVCAGSVVAFVRADGSTLANPYAAGVR